MKKSRFFFLLPIAFFLSCASTPTKSHEEQNAIEKALNQATANLYGTIAIADIKGNATQSLINEVMFEMKSAIEENPRLTLTDRDHINAVRREMNFNSSSFVDKNIKVTKGNIYGTYYVIYPTVTSNKKTDTLYIEILDIQTSTIKATARINIADLNGAESHVNRLARNPLAWIIIGIMTVGLPLGI